MAYFILLSFFMPHVGSAQSAVNGLGTYRIGITTPDSLNRLVFDEQESAVVKGTLALVCTHIRTFKAARVEVDGLLVTNLWLYFYDNKLFRLSCDYPADQQRAFVQKYGKGHPKPVNHFNFCARQPDNAMLMWGEVWPNGDVQALAVHARGYNADCQPEEAARLTISSQQLSALSSDCDLPNPNPYLEEFDK